MHKYLMILAALAMTSAVGCVMEDHSETWLGDEKWDDENTPDERPSTGTTGSGAYGEDCWTRWFDRDNPSGSGDWELRSLQPFSCGKVTAVECQTTSGANAYSTGEVITCNSSSGFLCLNSNQPDGSCDYDYRVRFYCINYDFCP